MQVVVGDGCGWKCEGDGGEVKSLTLASSRNSVHIIVVVTRRVRVMVLTNTVCVGCGGGQAREAVVN